MGTSVTQEDGVCAGHGEGPKGILVGRSDRRLEAGRELGADVTVNIKTEDLVEKIRQATDGHMVDAVIEAVGHKEIWPAIDPSWRRAPAWR